MRPRQKYVKLTQAQILVLPEQKEYVEQYVDRAGISINQYMRDVIQHAIECPFFNGRNAIGGNIPPAAEGGTQ